MILKGPDYEPDPLRIQRVRVQPARKINQNKEYESERYQTMQEWMKDWLKIKNLTAADDEPSLWYPDFGLVSESNHSLFSYPHTKPCIVFFENPKTLDETKLECFKKLYKDLGGEPWLVSLTDQDVELTAQGVFKEQNIVQTTLEQPDFGAWVASRDALVVLGGIGSANHKSKTFGHTVQYILKHLPFPVLVKDWTVSKPYQKIIVAWDGQTDSFDLILQARLLAEHWQTQLEVIYFGEDMDSSLKYLKSLQFEEWSEETLNPSDNLSHKIIQTVKKQNADLLFMKTSYPDCFEDSVTIDVLFHKPCDVWILRY